MNYVSVNTPVTPGKWVWVSIPAICAQFLIIKRQISYCHYTNQYAAVTDDWGGDWLTFQDMIQVPGAFIER